MSESTSLIQQIEAGTGAAEKLNENFDAASPAMLYGRRAEACTGLVFGYYGGRFGSTLIDNGTVTCTASQTNYVVANRSTGAVSVSTSSANWGNSLEYLRLYLVVANASANTSYQDHRQAFGGTGSSVSGENTLISLPVACGDEDTPITTGTKVTFHWPYQDTELSEVFTGLTTAQTSGSLPRVDVTASGASIFATKPTIDNGEETSLSAAAQPVFASGSPSPRILTKGEKIVISVDQIGDGTATGLKCYFNGRLV